MKNYYKYIFIFTLFILSLIYTDNIVNLAKNNDPIMKEIKKNYDSSKIESTNATIDNNYITPGINGCEIDVDKSYEYMKKINSYNDKLIKYKDILPEISINNIYNKYISNGNGFKRNISIVLYIRNNINIISNINNYKLNIFIDSNLLKDGKIDILNNNIKIYNGGNNLNYDYTTIEWMNDVISENYNISNYCINIEKNDTNLEECAKYKMHTINPNIIYSNFNQIKQNIKNGSIIYFNENNIKYINNISNYLIKKGYEIVYLDELLNEKNCN